MASVGGSELRVHSGPSETGEEMSQDNPSKCPSKVQKDCMSDDGLCHQPDKVYCLCPEVNQQAREWIEEQGLEYMFPRVQLPPSDPKKERRNGKLEYKGCEIKVYHLTTRFAIIAKAGYNGKDWKAYCGPVSDSDGISGLADEDLASVLERGSKVTRELGEFLFPEFTRKYTWR